MNYKLIKMNKFHPLLTDTLPYEVPVLFSNRGFYETIKKEYDLYYTSEMHKKSKGEEYNSPKTIEYFFKNIFMKDEPLKKLKAKIDSLFDGNLIPYEYMIAKNNTQKRKISLIHPISQIKICDFYEKYENEILFYTNKSDVSLRHPVKITSRIFRKHAKLLNKLTKEEAASCNDIVDVIENKGKIDLDDIPNNYFVYKRYRKIYEFYDSKFFLDLEQQYSMCFKFDIRRCFDSIYTHSIAWALKGKNYAKLHKKNGFENEIDTLIQNSNWQETHGIPIGSEFSRIFAEILLQSIDKEVEQLILSEDFKIRGRKIHKKVDFRIFRYVDDYFVFVNQEDVGKEILSIYENKLLEYKLFPNQDKSDILKRPFITPNTVAKYLILPQLLNVLRLFHNIDQSSERLNSNNIFSNKFNCSYMVKDLLDRIRVTLSETNVEMCDISNIILGTLKNDLVKILDVIMPYEKLSDDCRERIKKSAKKYINAVLDVAFYVFCLNPRSNSTVNISKICYEIFEFMKQIKDNSLQDEIRQKVYSNFLTFFECKKNENSNLMEFLDIIWIFNELGEKYKLSEEQLKNILQLKSNNFSYFELMVVLSYIKNDQDYKNIYNDIMCSIKIKLSEASTVFTKSDTFMLFFDVIKCPYIQEKFKKLILNTLGLDENHKAIIDFIQNRKWFFGWDEKFGLKKLFETKELHSPY